MKRLLADTANTLLRPLGVGIAKEGFDMDGAVHRLGQHAGGVQSVFDIGASNGRWSAMAMPSFPHARFIGIDPLAEREASLKALKAKDPRFDYILCVAGREADGMVELAVGEDLDGSTVGGLGEKRIVPSHSLDAIATMKGLQGPYLLKFDTHGFEVPILAGASAVLSDTAYIIMEVYNFRHTEGTLLFWEMCIHLEKLGFRCFNLVEPMHRPLDHTLWQMDLFFARHDNPIFASDQFKA